MKHKIKRLLSLLLSLMMLTAALPTSIWAEETGVAQATGAEAELPNEPEATAEPELPVESPEATGEPELPSDPTELPTETETPEGTAEPTPQVTEEPLPTPEPEAAYQAGVFVLVTENTRVFSDVDETADEVDGETAVLSAPQTSGWKKSGRTAWGEHGCWCAICTARKNLMGRWRGRTRRRSG